MAWTDPVEPNAAAGGTERHGYATQSLAGHGMSRLCKVRRGMASQGKARGSSNPLGGEELAAPGPAPLSDPRGFLNWEGQE